jgi:sulfatase-like protein
MNSRSPICDSLARIESISQSLRHHPGGGVYWGSGTVQISSMPVKSSKQDLPRVAVLCLSVATLLYARQIAMWASPRNRFYTHWQRGDTAMLAISLLAVALVLFLVVTLLRQFSWGERVLRWLTIILIADILVGYAVWTKGHVLVLTVAWIVLAGTGLYLAARPNSRFLERGTAVLAALAWLAPISLIQMLLWKSWDVRPLLEREAPSQAGPNQTPVFLFVFDEWSFRRSYDGTELRPFFHNLRKLASRSIEFTNAHSQAGSTNPSVPRIIFQREGILEPKNGISFWSEGDSLTPSVGLPSIFAAAHKRGYATSLVGFYFPYRAVLGDQVDHIVHQAYVPKGQRLTNRLAQVTARNLSFLVDPLSRMAWRKWNVRTVSENWFYINRTWRRAVHDLVRGSGPNTFAMVHWPLPHGPWVLNEDGSYHGPYKVSRLKATPEEYQRHLAFLDLVLGEAVAGLDSMDLLDRSLLIVTSDHSWKTDPDSTLAAATRTSVPLIVKLPHEKTGHRVEKEFCLGQLGALLQRVMDGSVSETNAVGEIPALPSSTSCTSDPEHEDPS